MPTDKALLYGQTNPGTVHAHTQHIISRRVPGVNGYFFYTGNSQIGDTRNIFGRGKSGKVITVQ
jgi:hypothetical protein